MTYINELICTNSSYINSINSPLIPPTLDLKSNLLSLLNNATYPVMSFDAFVTCKSQCSGPDYKLMEVNTKQCSCMAEWFGNASLISGALAVLLFLTLNVAR